MFILAVETLCVTILVVSNALTRPNSSEIWRFALLLGVATAYAEGADRSERLRRLVGYVQNSLFHNAFSLWCFAAALVLPVGLAGLLATIVYGHALVRARRHDATPPFRLIYTATTEILATIAAAALLWGLGLGEGAFVDGPGGALAVVAALLCYTVVNTALIAFVVFLVARPPRVRDILPGRQDAAMELANLALAVLFGVALMFAPYLAPITLVLIVVLRRSALVHELQVQATRDAKTGLLNAGAWRTEAERELVRAERLAGHTSVLMIDLDHFKALNDEHGHQAGDDALKAVADCLTDALRGYDAVGRFGGEEFVALLSEADVDEAVAVANRLCDRIRNLRLAHGTTVTASVGVGTGRCGEHDLDTLIAVADKALYAAKRAGRDRVDSLRAAPKLRQPRSA